MLSGHHSHVQVCRSRKPQRAVKAGSSAAPIRMRGQSAPVSNSTKPTPPTVLRTVIQTRASRRHRVRGRTGAAMTETRAACARCRPHPSRSHGSPRGGPPGAARGRAGGRPSRRAPLCEAIAQVCPVVGDVAFPGLDDEREGCVVITVRVSPWQQAGHGRWRHGRGSCPAGRCRGGAHRRCAGVWEWGFPDGAMSDVVGDQQPHLGPDEAGGQAAKRWATRARRRLASTSSRKAASVSVSLSMAT